MRSSFDLVAVQRIPCDAAQIFAIGFHDLNFLNFVQQDVIDHYILIKLRKGNQIFGQDESSYKPCSTP